MTSIVRSGAKGVEFCIVILVCGAERAGPLPVVVERRARRNSISGAAGNPVARDRGPRTGGRSRIALELRARSLVAARAVAATSDTIRGRTGVPLHALKELRCRPHRVIGSTGNRTRGGPP